MPHGELQKEQQVEMSDLLSTHYYYSSNLFAKSERKSQTTYPNHWDTSARGPSMRYLEVTGHRVRYKGPGSDDRDAAAVRADHSVPLSCPLYYFEIEIVNRGRDGFIGIGFAVADVKIDRLPGWEPNSYGYHGDDGHVFSGRGAGRHYGPVFTTGDWIGVIYNRMEKTISFTKKGIDLGIAFENVIEEPLYPTVGFRTPDEEIVANFGSDINSHPFRGDVEGIRRNAMQRAYSRILASTIPQKEGLQAEALIPDLVFEYLLHHGHWNSAAAVARDVMGGTRDVPDSLRHEAIALTSLSDAVCSGKIDEAYEIAENLAPGVFGSNPGILFSLECQKFCELIGQGKDEEAMALGRLRLGPKARELKDKQLLEEALTLFAYPNPRQAPAGYLLEDEHREELAMALQRAVRMKLGRQEISTLETVYREVKAMHEKLLESGNPTAFMVTVDEFIDQI